MTLKQILELCSSRGFLKLNASSGSVKIGPVGALLQENLHNEWLLSNVVNRDVTVFLNKSCSHEHGADFVKELCSQQLPFGVAEIAEYERKTSNFENCSVDEKKMTLRCTVFVTPSNSTQFFHLWQRQRRMWWRKFSAFPGRYSLTDIKTDGSGDQSVEISAKYPWGTELIETLNLRIRVEDNCNELLQAKDGRKKVQAHRVTNELDSSVMYLNTLCDAYEQTEFQGKPRAMFRFHRKLAPYKISFVVATTQTSNVQRELQQLATYLCKQLRGNRISSLLITSMWKNSLEKQWILYDQMGIPYNVVLNENTLKNGILLLRSRDTTLKEQVHVSDLANYVEQLFKNY